ncbi:MAG: hypothetical protein CVU39_21175 [Chloroflexi bacterium HGW-Chloroflexi-10]|nr:MAG: hypothetical protein CVU39_21175 [Chloroflexi bacterium HGW-Chloroflexi-10]
MSQSSRTFRVFISSTFSDLKEERDALQKTVFPRLRDLAMAHGCRFQAIDLRWGVSEEAALDQQTMKICLDEIDHCQQNNLKPNFLILMGDRYGWRPLPYEIPAEEMEKIKINLTPAQRQMVLWPDEEEVVGIPEMAAWNEGQVTGRLGWYRLDHNAIPEVYVLQPRPKGSYFDAYTTWEKEVEHPVGAALEQAARQAGLSEAALVKYIFSATGQEIFNGALQTNDGQKHVFGFLRSINNLDALENDLPDDESMRGNGSLARQFIDLNAEQEPDLPARSHLELLRKQIKEYLSDHVFEYTAAWTGNGISTGHLEQFCSDVESALRGVMESEFHNFEEKDPLQSEIEEHISFAARLNASFIGRREEISQIIDYYVNPLGSQFPLPILGSEGAGKSALIAAAYHRAQFYCKDGVTIVRFVGHTPDSANSRTLLAGLCQEIVNKYGAPLQEIPDDYAGLCKLFLQLLRKVRPEKPLSLCLDSIDRLESAKEEAFDWLPVKLPEGVRLVFSVGSQPSARLLQVLGQRFNPLTIKPLGRDEGQILLKQWLAEKQRTLTDNQREQVLNTLSRGPSPQALRFAFEQSLQWKSYTHPPVESGDLSSLIQRSFANLAKEENHGDVLVSRVLGYLANTRYGLTEDELLEVLSNDEVVMTDFHRRSPKSPDAQRLPVVIWARLNHDLSPFLTIRRHNGLEYLTLLYTGSDSLALWTQYEKVTVSEVQNGRFSDYAAPGAVMDWLRGKTILHARLANFFAQQPSFQDSAKSQPNWHRAGEVLIQYKLGGNLAGYPEQIYPLLLDYDYIQAKVRSFDISTLIEEYESVLSIGLAPEKERVLNLVNRALSLSSMAVKREVNQLAGQLVARLMPINEPEMTAFLNDIREKARRPYLLPLDSCLESPSASLVSAFNFDPLTKLAISANGRWGLKAFDRTLFILDLEKGEVLHSFATFSGYMPGGTITALAIFDDGKVAVSAKEDYLQVWDVQGIILHRTRTEPRCKVLKEHQSAITCLDISSADKDGKNHLAISGSKDGTIRLWNLDQFTCLKVLEGHTGAIKAVNLSDDGQWACSLAEDDTLKVWNVTQGKCVYTFAENIHGTRAAAISSNGNLVAFDRNKNILILDWKRKAIVRTLSGQLNWVKALSMSTKLVSTLDGGREGIIKVWDIQDGRCIRTFIHEGGLITARMNSSQALLFSGSTSGVIKTWSLAHNETGNTEAESRSHKKLLVSEDKCKVLASAADGEMAVYEAKSGKRLMRSVRHIGEISTMAVTPDGDHLVTGGEDGALLVWNLQNGERVLRLSIHPKAVLGVNINSAGDRSISFSFDEFAICDLPGSRCLHIIPEKVFAAAFLPHTEQAFTVSGNAIQLWDLEQGLCVKTIQTNCPEGRHAVVSSDGKQVTIAANDGEITVWDLANAKCLHKFNCGLKNIRVLALSPDDKRIALGAESKIEVWKVTGGDNKPIRSVRGYAIHSLEFHPAGDRLISGSEDGSINELNLSTGNSIKIIKDIISLRACRIAPDRLQMITTCKNRQNIQVWDLNKGEIIHSFETLFNRSYVDLPIHWLSPDGEALLVFSGNKDRRSDNEIHIYDLNKGLFTGSLKGHSDWIHSLAFVPGTQCLLSSSADGTLRLWNWVTGVELSQASGLASPPLHLLPLENGEQALAFCKDNSMLRVDLRANKILWSHQDLSSSLKNLWKNASETLVFAHSEDGSIRAWNMGNGQLQYTMEQITENYSKIAFSPDGTRAFACFKKHWKLWDLENGVCLKDMGTVHESLWRGISNQKRNHQICWGYLHGVHAADCLGDEAASIFQSKAEILSLEYFDETQLLWVTDQAGEIYRLCFVTDDHDLQISGIEKIESFSPIGLPMVTNQTVLAPIQLPPLPVKPLKQTGEKHPSAAIKDVSPQPASKKVAPTTPLSSSTVKADGSSTPRNRKFSPWFIALFILIFLIVAYLVFDQVIMPNPEVFQTPLPVVTQVVP